MNKPLSWDKLLLFHRNSYIGNIGRSAFIKNKYTIFKHLLNKRLGISNTEYIKNTILKSNDQYILTNNDFPYDLDNCVAHLILWINSYNKNNDWITSSVELNNLNYFQEIVKRELIQKYKHTKLNNKSIKYIYFENSEKNRSIPGIRHIHIFVLK